MNNNLVGSQSVQYESYEVRTHGSVITSPDSNPELPETMEDTIHTDKFNHCSFFPFPLPPNKGTTTTTFTTNSLVTKPRLPYLLPCQSSTSQLLPSNQHACSVPDTDETTTTTFSRDLEINCERSASPKVSDGSPLSSLVAGARSMVSEDWASELEGVVELG